MALCSVMTMAGLFNRSSPAALQFSVSKARQHAGAFKVLLEQIRTIIQMEVFVDWETLFIYLANPKQRAPSTEDWLETIRE